MRIHFLPKAENWAQNWPDGSRADFIAEWGEPNITDYGKNYGQGPYEAYNYLGESGSLY